MKLNELKTLFKSHAEKQFRLQLPDGSPVPVSFHVTEVGHVHKTFIDCGGTLREVETCQLQVWIGEDGNHRLEAGKAAAILEKASSFLKNGSMPVEVEYEDEVISQYTIDAHDITSEAVILTLAHKHTDCLAKELCGVSTVGKDDVEEDSCCSSKGCC